MTTDALIEALEREHHEIDKDIDRFLRVTDDTARASASLLRAISALRRHIYLEEEFFFPALTDPALAAPVFVMLREHAQMWQLLDSLEQRARTHDGGPAATRLCRQLVVQLQHHNQKEERIIYAAAADTISPEVAGRIDQHSRDTREAPLGWVCVKART